MSRHVALNVLLKRLFIITSALLAVSLFLVSRANEYTVPLIIFIAGNLGGYVGFHRRLGSLKDDEIKDLATSWFAVVLPSFIGGILAGVLYLLFISGIINGDLFPKIIPDAYCYGAREKFNAIFCQHAKDHADYGKLLFWSFVAGFNQNYVVDLIATLKGGKG